MALLPWPQPLTGRSDEVAEVFRYRWPMRALEPRSELRELKDFRRRIYSTVARQQHLGLHGKRPSRTSSTYLMAYATVRQDHADPFSN